MPQSQSQPPKRELRFQRRLTHDEMCRLHKLAKKDIEACFIAMWDILLWEGEGYTYQQAHDKQCLFDVAKYAIPQDQEALIRAWMAAKKNPLVRNKINWTFLNLGPSTYLEGEE